MIRKVILLSILFSFMAGALFARDDIRVERVQFEQGNDSAIIRSSITGYDTIDYVLGASQGQSMTASMATDNTASYFNILEPDEDQVAMFNGSINGNQYEGQLPETGDYKIRIYLMRSAARRNETANYNLEIIINADDMEKTSQTVPSDNDALVSGTNYHATGNIPCTVANGQPNGFCPFGVTREGNGSGLVTVTKPDGRTRVIFFENGTAIGADVSQADPGEFSAKKESDLSIILIGDERYEIPDAVIFGGCEATIEKSGFPMKVQSADHTLLPDGPNLLANTRWRLIEFQSMDDAVGILRPDDPSRYVMRLNGDGSVEMRLNCNSARGTWSAEGGRDRSSGRFQFGPLAVTRALCPPPSLDEQISSQAQYVRSLLMKDGRLYLSLMADGGIYVWEPQTEEPYRTEPSAELEAAVLQVFPDYTRDVVDLYGGVGGVRYVYGRVDLNGDGQDEVFVYLLGSFFCGTGGCNLLLFSDTEDGYLLINEFSTSRIPIFVSDESTDGWKNIVWLKSGGGVPSSYLNHTFNGRRYIEGNKMPADKVPMGQSYLAGELLFDKAISLEPRN